VGADGKDDAGADIPLSSSLNSAGQVVATANPDGRFRLEVDPFNAPPECEVIVSEDGVAGAVVDLPNCPPDAPPDAGDLDVTRIEFRPQLGASTWELKLEGINATPGGEVQLLDSADEVLATTTAEPGPDGKFKIEDRAFTPPEACQERVVDVASAAETVLIAVPNCE